MWTSAKRCEKKTNKLRENTVDNPFTHLTRAHSSRRHKTPPPPPHFAVEIYNWIKQPGDDYHLFFFLFGLLFPTKGSCTGWGARWRNGSPSVSFISLHDISLFFYYVFTPENHTIAVKKNKNKNEKEQVIGRPGCWRKMRSDGANFMFLPSKSNSSSIPMSTTRNCWTAGWPSAWLSFPLSVV